MSPARNAAATKRPARARRTAVRQAPRPRRVASRPPPMRVRWDRAGRIGLLVVLAVVAGLYVQHTVTLLQTHSQAEAQLATVQRLARANASLVKQIQSLNDPATIQRDARALGMVRPGERPYVITGLQH